MRDTVLILSNGEKERNYKNISQAIDEMMEDSKTEGIEKGKLEVLSNLLKKGTISIQDAADCMAVSVAEFKKLVNKYPI